MKCIAKNCTNCGGRTKENSSKISFFRFPKKTELRQKWLQFCGLPSDFSLVDSMRLCSYHFDHSQLYFTKEGGKILKLAGAVPTFDVQLKDSEHSLIGRQQTTPFVREPFQELSLNSSRQPLHTGGRIQTTPQMIAKRHFSSGESTETVLEFYDDLDTKQSPAQLSQLRVFPRSSQEWRSSEHSAVPKGFCDVSKKTIFDDLMTQSSRPFNSALMYDDSRDQQISTMEPMISTTTADGTSSSCHTCNELYSKCELQQREIRQLKHAAQENDMEHSNLKRKYEELHDRYNEHPAEKISKQMFNDDQYQLLSGQASKMSKWSDESITEGLRARFKMSHNMYERERKKLRLPSYRTLNERLQHIHFKPGLLDEVFLLIESKVPYMLDADLDCSLIFDEMAIAEGLDYCLNNKNFFGNITLPNHTGSATHVMLFMLVGVRQKWKQIVAYHFTGSSIEKGCLKDIIFQVIRKSESIGLRVHVVVSDCGSNNKRLWNDLGILHAKLNVGQNKPPSHPCDENRSLEVIPDCVHIFKSAVQGWIKNRTVTIPKTTMEKQRLSSRTADIMHIRDMVLYESQSRLKMVSGLTKSDVDFDKQNNNFDKMKVPNSTKYVNDTVAAALKVYAINTNRPEVLTTAFYVENLAKWFKLVTAREIKLALSKRNQDVYKSTLQFFGFFKCFIHRCSVGVKKLWKPWQAAIIMATDALLRLQHFFLSNGYDFLFLSRFTQDCVENIFSQLRIKSKTPRALHVKNNLKLLTIGQVMEEVSNTSYENSLHDWLVDFSEKLESMKSHEPNEIKTPEEGGNVEESEYQYESKFQDSEQAIYYVAGVILRRLKENNTLCDQCIACCTDNNESSVNLALFTSLKDYTGHALIYVNVCTYTFFAKLETILSENIDNLKTSEEDISKKLFDLMIGVEAAHFRTCHNMKHKIVRRFILFRLRSSMWKPERQRRYDSKSMV